MQRSQSLWRGWIEGQEAWCRGKRRIWRKRHIAVDTITHYIVATELTSPNTTDAEVFTSALKQTCRQIIEISADGAYDKGVTTMSYCAKQAVPLSPQRKGAIFWEQRHPSYFAVGCQKPYTDPTRSGEIKPNKSQCPECKDLRHAQSSEQAYRVLNDTSKATCIMSCTFTELSNKAHNSLQI